jgi:hypothetical protein
MATRMLRHGTRCRGAKALLAPFLLAAATLGLAETARAVPHTISAADHPLDPDWPDVFLFLSNKCAACHRPNNERTDFSTYSSLMAAKVNGSPLIVPGSAERSPLWEYVAWNASAVRGSGLPSRPEMPPDHLEWLSAGQLETLRRWIERGAFEYRLPKTCANRPVMEMDFPSARQCKMCHPKQFDEWSRSMHAYAQHSPVFEAFNLTLEERTGGTLGTFCTRCHTQIGTALGENGLRRNIDRSRISMEGVTCVVCHRRSVGQYKDNGRIAVEPGPLHSACMYGPFETSLSKEVGAHGAARFPYIKTSQFCGDCHDVTSPDGVRNEEAFSEWQNSPAARQRITCQLCHMGPVQGVPVPECDRPLGRVATVPGVDPSRVPLRRLSDHTFAGPDYSLLPDTEFPHKLDWMYETDYRDTARLTPYQQKSLTELRISNRKHLALADAKRYELLQNGARIRVKHPEQARAGEVVRVRVDVESIFSGHSFPTGFTAERQLWVAASVRDPAGRVVFASGDLDENTDLRDDHSHAVLSGLVRRDPYLLNFQNKFIALGNKGTERSVVVSVNRHVHPVNVVRPAQGISAAFGHPPAFRIAKGSLPPLRTMGQTYPVLLCGGPGPYTVDVKLQFRHLPPALLDHIGTPHLKHLLEVVVIDAHQGVIETH